MTESRFSGRPSRAPSEKSDKRERILRAAVKVFARKGFYASRVSEIAKAAGVADGTIYLYFKSKDDFTDFLNTTEFFVTNSKVVNKLVIN